MILMLSYRRGRVSSIIWQNVLWVAFSQLYNVSLFMACKHTPVQRCLPLVLAFSLTHTLPISPHPFFFCNHISKALRINHNTSHYHCIPQRILNRTTSYKCTSLRNSHLLLFATYLLLFATSHFVSFHITGSYFAVLEQILGCVNPILATWVPYIVKEAVVGSLEYKAKI